MCGFFSTYLNNLKNDADFEKRCKVSLNLLSHRGPDDLQSTIHHKHFLGFNRLSIIDRNMGRQPMFDDEKNTAILFNGEIFNYKELQIYLKNKNIKLKTNSDTEVIINLYKLHKDKVYDFLRGMFSFIIYDFKNDEIFAARDRYGIKPFYYYQDENNDNFIFASEPKSIKNFYSDNTDYNLQKINEFLVFGYSCDESSFINNIKVLEPGNCLTIKDKKKMILKKWEPFGNHDEEIDIDKKKALHTFEGLFEDSVKLWTTSDVPVASLMSGGIDSSLITSVAACHSDIKSFSAIFSNDKSINEKKNIDEIIKFSKRDNFEIFDFSEENLYKYFDNVTTVFDAPVNDPNNITLYALCNKIKKNFDYKVVLCGEGADELFGGYGRHSFFYNKLKNSKNHEEIIIANNFMTIDRLKSINWGLEFDFSNRRKIFDDLKSKKLFNKILEYDQKTFLLSRLYSQDSMGMANSIEIRTPFLEHKLTEFVNSLPIKLKNNGIYTKYLLRLYSEKFLPRSVSWDKKKIGLSFSCTESFKNGNLKNIFLENITNKSKISNFCDISKLKNLFNVHTPYDESLDHSNTLWKLLSLEIWLNKL